MKLRTLHEALTAADEVRSLTEDTHNALRSALVDLALCLDSKIKWALMGGLAVGFHARPRGTQDIDIILLGEADIDVIARLTTDKFKKSRNHALTHKQTGVEVELLTPEFLKKDPELMDAVVATATQEDLGGITVPVVSRGGLVAAKLQRMSRQDAADIEAIIRAGGPVDLGGFPLSQEMLKFYKEIENDIS